MAFRGPLEDRLLIRERYDTYSDAVFRADTEEYMACWTEDAVRSGAGGACTGHAELRAHFEGMWQSIERMTFFTQLASIEVEADRATARVFSLELVGFRSGETRHVVGRYDDVLRRRSGSWLFAERRYEVASEWSRSTG